MARPKGHKDGCACPPCRRERGESVPNPGGFRTHPDGCTCRPCGAARGETLAPGDVNHKPDCYCTLCATRRRETKALALRNRGERVTITHPTDILNADPIILDKPSQRGRILAWIEMRAQDPNLSIYDASLKMGLARNSLSSMVSRAVREGWLKFDDPMERLEHEIIPKTLDNLKTLLDDGDKQATIEVAKGTLFKQFQESKGINQAPSTILALKIEAVDPAGIKVMTGHIVGAPRTSQIIDVEKEN